MKSRNTRHAKCPPLCGGLFHSQSECGASITKCFKKYAQTHSASIGYNIILTSYGLRPACLIPLSTIPTAGSCLDVFMQNLKICKRPLSESVLVYNPHVVNVDALTSYRRNSFYQNALGTVLGYQTPLVRGCYPRMSRTVYTISFNGIEVYCFVDHGGFPNDNVLKTLRDMAIKWDETLNGLGLKGVTIVTAKWKRRQPVRCCRLKHFKK